MPEKKERNPYLFFLIIFVAFVFVFIAWIAPSGYLGIRIFCVAVAFLCVLYILYVLKEKLCQSRVNTKGPNALTEVTVDTTGQPGTDGQLVLPKIAGRVDRF